MHLTFVHVNLNPNFREARLQQQQQYFKRVTTQQNSHHTLNSEQNRHVPAYKKKEDRSISGRSPCLDTLDIVHVLRTQPGTVGKYKVSHNHR